MSSEEKGTGVYFGNRKQTGANHLVNSHMKRENYMTAGIRGKGGDYIHDQEPEFDAEGFARAAAANAATGAWMGKINRDSSKSAEKSADAMEELYKEGFSFGQIQKGMKDTGREVLDSSNDVQAIKDYWNLNQMRSDIKDLGEKKDAMQTKEAIPIKRGPSLDDLKGHNEIVDRMFSRAGKMGEASQDTRSAELGADSPPVLGGEVVDQTNNSSIDATKVYSKGDGQGFKDDYTFKVRKNMREAGAKTRGPNSILA
tara:strand:- start:734 stop:1501 length:768 start_codon:yes stop_codon:yes gene_type:complete